MKNGTLGSKLSESTFPFVMLLSFFYERICEYSSESSVKAWGKEGASRLNYSFSAVWSVAERKKVCYNECIVAYYVFYT